MDGAPPPWQVYADTVLQRAALEFRESRGEPARDFAGLVIDDAEIRHLVAELPGLRSSRQIPDDLASSLSRQVGEAHRAMVDQLTAPDDLFTTIVWNIALSEPEADVFALLCATELDQARQTLVAYVNDNVALKRPTLGLLARLFPPPHLGPRVLGTDRALLRAALVTLGDGEPWARTTVQLAPSVAWMLAGDRSLDSELPVGIRLELTSEEPGGAAIVLVTRGDPQTRRLLSFNRSAATAFLVGPCPDDVTGWEAIVRQATVSGLGVVIELSDHQTLPALGKRVIERTPHLPWVISSRYDLPVESLPTGEHVDISAVSSVETVRRGVHVLDPEQDRLVGLTEPGRRGEWDAAVRRLAGGHLDQLAVRVRPRRSWDDVVLAPDQLAQVQELVARYRRGGRVYDTWGFSGVPSRGLTGLFSGPSGTGKTMTSEVVAAELGLDMYRVDLSTVVSKYIGETEKNLERIFTAATAGNVVLFFDEADALFGKRTEVGDAHDRYANIEVSYLLQRLEQYNGVVILATNLRKNIDAAFLRRIDVAIEFVLPERLQRRAIWEKSFPTTAPVGDLDFDFLAGRFDVAGGNITNAALAAAFLAANRNEPIEMEDVVLGMKREFQKLGRLRTEREFERYLDLVNGERHVAPAG